MINLGPTHQQVKGVLPAVNGGWGTASPTLIGGTGITITGNFPNQAINGTPYPAAGVACSTGMAWCSSPYQVGTAPGNLVQLDGSGRLPPVSAQLLTNFPTLNQNTTGTAGNLSGTPTLPNGVRGITQTVGDNSTLLATDAFVAAAVSSVTAGVISFSGRAGNVVPQSGDYTVGQITGAAPLASPTFTGTPVVPGYVTTSTTVNTHALTGNIVISASDLTTGTLPHAQLPALLSADIPNNAANTTGNAATATVAGNLTGTPTLPNGTAGFTQTNGDNSSKLATDAYVFGYFHQNNTWAATNVQKFSVSGASSALDLGVVTAFPSTGGLAVGSMAIVQPTTGGQSRLSWWDGTNIQGAVTVNDTPAVMANGVTGTGGPTVLQNSPTINNANLVNPVANALTLNLLTWDLFDYSLTPGGTASCTATPAAGHLKTCYDSSLGYTASYNGDAFAQIARNQFASAPWPVEVVGTPLNLTSQTASVTATNLLASAPVGQYLVTGYWNEVPVLCSNVTAGTVVARINYQDSQGAITNKVLGTMSFTTSGSGNAQVAASFYQAVVGNIAVSTNYVACTTGTGTYDIHFTLQRVQ